MPIPLTPSADQWQCVHCRGWSAIAEATCHRCEKPRPSELMPPPAALVTRLRALAHGMGAEVCREAADALEAAEQEKADWQAHAVAYLQRAEKAEQETATLRARVQAVEHALRAAIEIFAVIEDPRPEMDDESDRQANRIGEVLAHCRAALHR